MMQRSHSLVLLTLAILLSACGGGERVPLPETLEATPILPPPTEAAMSSSVETVAATATVEPPAASGTLSGEARGVRLSIVYDNNVYEQGLRSRWGFGALVEYGAHTFLFDTGGNGFLLLSNMEKMGLDPHAIEFVVLSHIHGDHTDGLRGLLNSGLRPAVYAPASFPASFKEEVRAHTELYEVAEPMEILPGVHSTGELQAAVREQGLVIETSEGSVVITGCAHPGIVRMVRAAREIVDDDIALVVGGFHLSGKSQQEIEGIISDFRALGVQRVTPTHCTGEKAIQMFADAYGNDYVKGGVGRVIEVGPVPGTP